MNQHLNDALKYSGINWGNVMMLETIKEKIDKFHNDTGNPPEKIKIGWANWHKLVEEIKNECPEIAKKGVNYIKFVGINLYKDDKNARTIEARGSKSDVIWVWGVGRA